MRRVGAKVLSFEQALEDSNALAEIARDAGVTLESARKVVAAIYFMRVDQAVRMLHAAAKMHPRPFGSRS